MTKKNRQAAPDDNEESPDPLGGLLSRYHVSLAGVLIVAGVLALIGLGLVGYALTREPIALIILGIGTAVLLVAFAFLGMNIFNVGRRLELRKKGIRFVEAGAEIDILWSEVVDIQVNRDDTTNLGPVRVRTRGSHYAGPSGPLTNTELDVTICGSDGRTIHLGPRFLKTVPDVRKLVSQIRMRAGI